VNKSVSKPEESLNNLRLHFCVEAGRFRQEMSKARYSETAPHPIRLGNWLRQLREQRELTLREVADAVQMDLAHLQKIELGQRQPTEEQASRLAKFFKLDETEIQARRIAEKFQHEFAGHPAAKDAISILAEEAGVYKVRSPRSESRKKDEK
jgi:HTH-type transcriptional regulator, competence development regulator